MNLPQRAAARPLISFCRHTAPAPPVAKGRLRRRTPRRTPRATCPRPEPPDWAGTCGQPAACDDRRTPLSAGCKGCCGGRFCSTSLPHLWWRPSSRCSQMNVPFAVLDTAESGCLMMNVSHLCCFVSVLPCVSLLILGSDQFAIGFEMCLGVLTTRRGTVMRRVCGDTVHLLVPCMPLRAMTSSLSRVCLLG